MSGLYDKWVYLDTMRYAGTVGRFDLYVNYLRNADDIPYHELRIVWDKHGPETWHYSNVKDGHLIRPNNNSNYLTNPPSEEEMRLIEQYVRCFVPELADKLAEDTYGT